MLKFLIDEDMPRSTAKVLKTKGFNALDVDALLIELSDKKIDYAEEGQMIIHFSKDGKPVLLEILDAKDFILHEERGNTMAEAIKVWYDKEGDYLEVLFERKAGYFKETENDAVMEKVDDKGNVIGFSILKVSALKEQKPLSIELKRPVA